MVSKTLARSRLNIREGGYDRRLAIYLIHTTSATVATCNMQYSFNLDLEQLRLQKMDIG